MGCLQAIGCLLCLAVLAVAGVLAWRYGPWYEDGTTTEAAPPDTLAALGACEGCCNLLASNCDRPVNEVLFPAVHNAMSSYDDLFAGANNNRPLEEALVAGYRGLMLDSCICDGSIGETLQNLIKGEDDKGENYLGFCHGSCDAGVRDPAQVLRNVKTFLDVNPNEVLILEFEVTDNSLEQLFNAIDDSGLDEYIYRPSATDAEWPTMQTLIDTGARALVFAHGDGMDQSCTATNCPEGIMYTFDHFEQTEWNGEAAPTGCDVIGTEREAQSFFLMNHWKNSEDTGLPSEDNAEVYNTYDKLMERFTSCTERIPTVLAVDFWSIGDVLSFTEEVNQRNAGVVAGKRYDCTRTEGPKFMNKAIHHSHPKEPAYVTFCCRRFAVYAYLADALSTVLVCTVVDPKAAGIVIGRTKYRCIQGCYLHLEWLKCIYILRQNVKSRQFA